MLKETLKNSITKELKIVRRLASKIVEDNQHFRPKDGIRSKLELLQYLSYCGTAILEYWLRTDSRDFRTFMTEIAAPYKTLTLEEIIPTLDKQIELTEKLFEQISEDDLFKKLVDLPGGVMVPLASGLIECNIKWLTAYKMQLFVTMKMGSDLALGTPDLWRKTELQE